LKTPGGPIAVDTTHAPDLRGRHVLVTGASRGIGAAVARELAQHGANVSLVSRHYAEVEEARKQLTGGSRHVALEADVTDASAVDRMVADAVARSGPPFALVNNAGGGEAVAFADTDEAHWRRMIDANLMSAVFCTQAVLPAMRERHEGRIIQMASTASLRGYRHVSAYTAGKHALLGLTRSLAIETEKDGVTVNAVCPGYVHTERLGESLQAAAARTGMSVDDVRARFAASNAGGRLMEPREVAAVVAWLCGAQAALVSGRHIVVDGRPLEAHA
jgi:NAD(P)-dependent dehydrogenase (short-subunit alcohol dehydrogenase family)